MSRSSFSVSPSNPRHGHFIRIRSNSFFSFRIPNGGGVAMTSGKDLNSTIPLIVLCQGFVNFGKTRQLLQQSNRRACTCRMASQGRLRKVFGVSNKVTCGSDWVNCSWSLTTIEKHVEWCFIFESLHSIILKQTFRLTSSTTGWTISDGTNNVSAVAEHVLPHCNSS